jgi:hypothetical protein
MLKYFHLNKFYQKINQINTFHQTARCSDNISNAQINLPQLCNKNENKNRATCFIKVFVHEFDISHLTKRDKF